MTRARILLADDHELFREGLAGLINAQPDLEVVGEAGDGLEALTLARNLHPDLIVMDISMPICDGLEATRLIRAAHDVPKGGIVILTVHDEDEKLFEAIKAGANGYLLKSTNSVGFLRGVRGALAGEAALPPKLATRLLDEFARLAKYGEEEKPSRDEQVKMAQELAASHGVVILLKGNRTVITDGQQTAENTTGNPGMATGGTGDVLTGIITALVCQGLSPFDAAVLGAHVHGLAGDLAAKELGQISLIASDLLKYLPAAFQSLAPNIGD